jgi:DNA-binding transcriptional ArsR family regulator
MRRNLDIGRLFHALGDPTRRAIVERLSDRPLSVSELASPLKISLTAVVQHLQILEECRLVRTEKIGRMRTCRIDSRGLNTLEQWIRDLRTHWEERLDRLGDLLDEEKDS